MIDRGHRLSLVRQVELLRLSRSSLYYEPRAVPAADLATMRRIDALHLDHPFAGSRMYKTARSVARRGCRDWPGAGRHDDAAHGDRGAVSPPQHVQAGAGATRLDPYLLRGMAVERPNQGLGDGYYLHPHGTRLRLSGRRGGLVQPAGSGLARVDHDGGRFLPRGGRGGVGQDTAGQRSFNTDQGSQFTSAAFTGLLMENAIKISMDGRGSWRDNVFCSSGYGGRSNMRKSICELTTASATRVPRWAGIWIFTTASWLPTLEPRRADPGASLLRAPAAARGSLNFAAVVGASPRSGYALPA